MNPFQYSPQTEPSHSVTTADFKPGQLVRFVPSHADGDINHPDCENGRVTSTNDKYVFVRFGHSEGGQACNPDQLK